MAVSQDGTNAFGIEASPVTINGEVFVAEDFSFSRTGTRADINDQNGEPSSSLSRQIAAL